MLTVDFLCAECMFRVENPQKTSKLCVYPLNLAGNPSPVAQKGTRSKYRVATILKSPLLDN